MKTSSVHVPYVPAVAALALLAVIGCADPAADKPAAEVSEPAATETPAGDEGLTLSFTEDSKIGFVGSKVTGKHDGGFNEFDGAVTLIDGDPTLSRVEVTIDTTSIWSDNDRLTGHLKSEDFFEVETYPTATFESTVIEATEDGYRVTGNLDLHGVEKQIVFPAQITVADGRVDVDAEFSIQRFDFDIVYKGMADDLIRDAVLIKLDLAAE